MGIIIPACQNNDSICRWILYTTLHFSLDHTFLLKTIMLLVKFSLFALRKKVLVPVSLYSIVLVFIYFLCKLFGNQLFCSGYLISTALYITVEQVGMQKFKKKKYFSVVLWYHHSRLCNEKKDLCCYRWKCSFFNRAEHLQLFNFLSVF